MAKQKVTCYALVPALLTACCSIFPYGFIVGISNSATIPFQQFYRESHMSRYNVELPKATLDTLWTLTAVILAIGGLVGCLLLGPLVARFGIRTTIVHSQVICCFASLLMSLSFVLKSYESFIIGRLILGIFCGIGLGAAPMYISEISALHVRGILGMCVPLCAVSGVTIGNTLGLKQILGTATTWPYLVAIAALPSIACIAYSPWMPQSPKALYLVYNDNEGTENLLKKLRGSDDVADEMLLLQEEKEMFTTKHARWQMLSAAVLGAAFQLNGLIGIQFYLNGLLIRSGILPDVVGYVALSITGFQILVIFTGGFLSEKFGRRILLLVGNFIIVISIILYTLVVAFQSSVPWLSYVSIATLLGAVFGFSVGPAAITFTIIAELLDQSARPAAMTLASSMLWICLALVFLVAPLLFEHLKFGALLPFMAATTAVFVFIYVVIPETKGKSVVEIQALYAKRNNVTIKDVVISYDNQTNNISTVSNDLNSKEKVLQEIM